VDSSKKPDEAGRQRNLTTIRGTEAWKLWLDGLAAKERMSIAALIDKSLAATAKAVGYPEPPPRF
jgi:hypothetical protein